MAQPIDLTSPKVVQKNQPLTLAWKLMAHAEVRKFTLLLGTEPGKWDIFNGELGKDINEITLPPVEGNLAKLFVELSYTAPEDQSTNQAPHQHEENIMHGEEPIEITVV